MSLQPIFQQIVTAHVDAQKIQKDAYITLLKRHDWLHESSDDYRVYSKGKQERQTLEMVQPELDPDFAIWNEHCHRLCRKVLA